ncbi:hypothetical protein CCR75_001009 [Bremia lactucae]|uniref:Ribosomal protein S18 n=1 Tax=Bremia lactucae TaxID=4779 RepID=A0A976IHZ1_BRELC|nr:hypothetical protein CCR75_001009 [Bremia lactucae]
MGSTRKVCSSFLSTTEANPRVDQREVNVLGRRIGPNVKVAIKQTQTSATLSVSTTVSPLLSGVRSLATKGKDGGKKEFKKKSTFDKVESVDDITELPEEVKYLSRQLDENDFLYTEKIELDDDDDDEEDTDLNPTEWAKNFEREVAQWDQEAHDSDEDGELFDLPSDVEDDRLYVEMPGYDASLSLAESQIGGHEEKNGSDPFRNWEQGMAISPEMLNWMLPPEQRKPFRKETTKPWKYFVAANHPDVVELALDVDLLRLFISPTGRIRPRRFTGLTAKQQRRLAQAIKVSRQLALLPYLSRYPEPTPEQWQAIDKELIAAAELDENSGNFDDDDEDFDEDFEYD